MATFTGTNQNDDLDGTYDADLLSGLAGDDNLFGNDGNDTLNGGDGNDTLNGGGASDIIDFGAGTGVGFEYSYAWNGNDTYYPSSNTGTEIDYRGHDQGITVNVGENTVTINKTGISGTTVSGQQQTDIIQNINQIEDSALGIAIVTPQSDSSFYVNNTSNLGFVFFSNNGGDIFNVTNGNVYVDFYYVEKITFTGENGSRSTGTAVDSDGDIDTLQNVKALVASAGADVFNGGSGDDTIILRHGNDTIDGGAGTDTVSFDKPYGVTHSSGADVDLSSGTGQGEYNGNVFNISISNVENIIGSSHADTISGSSASETFSGLGGNDALNGQGGADTLEGGDGNDFIVGGNGDDSASGGAGNDQIYAGSGDTGSDTFYGGSGNDTIGGGNGADSLYGENGNDALYGGANNDFISAGGGTDTAWAGNGNDTVWGGAGADIFGGGGGADALAGGSDADTIYGAAGTDQVIGAEGNDALYGGDGNDTITGGSGNDSLFGGSADDTFIFETDHGDDYLGGFETKGSNIIDLSALDLAGFDALNISQSAADVVIDTGAGTITLWNADQSDITAADFVF